jgi:5-methylcytosine-specific restriction endonuclease McrA
MRKKLTSIKPRVAPADVRTCSTPVVERIRGKELQKIRERILLRDEYSCRACGRVSAHLEIDHIVPIHLGGAESDQNRQALCRQCHEKKSEREGKERG